MGQAKVKRFWVIVCANQGKDIIWESVTFSEKVLSVIYVYILIKKMLL